MKERIKKMIDASTEIQKIIVDAAKGAGRLNEEQVNKVCKLLYDANPEEYDMDTLGMIREMVEGDVNLIEGPKSAAAAFDPLEVVKACRHELSSEEFGRIKEYAEKMRVSY